MSNILKINGNVWLCGDLHRNVDLFLQTCKKNDIRNSSIIILGDCEVGFRKEHPNKFYNYLSKQLALRNNTLYLVRGNHDNPDHWHLNPARFFRSFREEFDITKIIDSVTLNEKWPNIFHLFDNSIININGDNYFVCGGAVSIDRVILKTGTTYFPGERLHASSRLSYNLSLLENPVIGVLAHTGPRPPILDKKQLNRRCAVDKRLADDLAEEESSIREIMREIRPKFWYNGHFHVSYDGEYNITVEDKTKYKCLNICEFYKLY